MFEKFLKNCDIDNAIQQANKELDFDKIADEMEQDLKDSAEFGYNKAKEDVKHNLMTKLEDEGIVKPSKDSISY